MIVVVACSKRRSQVLGDPKEMFYTIRNNGKCKSENKKLRVTVESYRITLTFLALALYRSFNLGLRSISLNGYKSPLV